MSTEVGPIEIVVDLDADAAEASTSQFTQALMALQRTTEITARATVMMAEGQRQGGSDPERVAFSA